MEIDKRVGRRGIVKMPAPTLEGVHPDLITRFGAERMLQIVSNLPKTGDRHGVYTRPSTVGDGQDESVFPCSQHARWIAAGWQLRDVLGPA
jgi:hypothetical protein